MQISPVGRLEWAKLFQPDKKFASEQKPHGIYSIDLILPKDEAAPLLKLLKEMDDANFKQTANDALKEHREKNGKKDKFKRRCQVGKKRRQPGMGHEAQDGQCQK